MVAIQKPAEDRMMIVAADAAFRDAGASIAEKLGFELYSTGQTSDFREIVYSLSPTVIVLDLELLGAQRMGLLGFLARGDYQPHLLLLAGSDDEDAEKALRLSEPMGLKRVDVIRQPVDFADFEARVNALKLPT